LASFLNSTDIVSHGWRLGYGFSGKTLSPIPVDRLVVGSIQPKAEIANVRFTQNLPAVQRGIAARQHRFTVREMPVANGFRNSAKR
jgi:hypothetical protein